jgi:hypothetical protein
MKLFPTQLSIDLDHGGMKQSGGLTAYLSILQDFCVKNRPLHTNQTLKEKKTAFPNFQKKLSFRILGVLIEYRKGWSPVQGFSLNPQTGVDAVHH